MERPVLDVLSALPESFELLDAPVEVPVLVPSLEFGRVAEELVGGFDVRDDAVAPTLITGSCFLMSIEMKRLGGPGATRPSRVTTGRECARVGLGDPRYRKGDRDFQRSRSPRPILE